MPCRVSRAPDRARHTPRVPCPAWKPPKSVHNCTPVRWAQHVPPQHACKRSYTAPLWQVGAGLPARISVDHLGKEDNVIISRKHTHIQRSSLRANMPVPDVGSKACLSGKHIAASLLLEAHSTFHRSTAAAENTRGFGGDRPGSGSVCTTDSGCQNDQFSGLSRLLHITGFSSRTGITKAFIIMVGRVAVRHRSARAIARVRRTGAADVPARPPKRISKVS